MQTETTSAQLDRALLRAGAAQEDVSPALFRQVMGCFATGITVITTEIDGEVHGMTANAFMAGSLRPPLCVISVRNESRLCGMLHRSNVYGVSLLTEQQRHLSTHFAGQRLAAVAPEFRRCAGVPVLDRALAVIAADVVDTAACGDHTLFIGHIARMEAGEGKPLLFSRGRYARIDEDSPIERIVPPTFW
ncbi:MAG: flavin reductase family protein [Rubricoccaceae bacterium]|nr:flavin reductase family protein [Rubricoccaceae bacterium]